MNKNIAIILCAGEGKRLGGSVKKQFIQVYGKPLFLWSLQAFTQTERFDRICLVVKDGDIPKIKKIIKSYYINNDFVSLIDFVVGGKNRYDSVYNALCFCKAFCKPDDNILIHDSARPLITKKDILKILDCLKTEQAVTLGYNLSDTVKEHLGSYIKSHLKRENLCGITTPQAFKFDIIYNAHNKISDKNDITDDSQLVDKIGIKCKILLTDNYNFKVTTKKDLKLIEFLLKSEN